MNVNINTAIDLTGRGLWQNCERQRVPIRLPQVWVFGAQKWLCFGRLVCPNERDAVWRLWRREFRVLRFRHQDKKNRPESCCHEHTRISVVHSKMFQTWKPKLYIRVGYSHVCHIHCVAHHISRIEEKKKIHTEREPRTLSRHISQASYEFRMPLETDEYQEQMINDY